MRFFDECFFKKIAKKKKVVVVLKGKQKNKFKA
jgi:hypothetical protein